MNRSVKTGMYNKDGKDFEFHFYTDIRNSEKAKLISFVSETIIGENYISILKDMIFNFAIINFFSDVDLSDIKEAPDSLNKIEDFLYENNIIDVIKKNVEKGVIEELYDSVNKNIEYKTGIRENSLYNSLIRLCNTIESKFSNIDVNELNEFAKSISSISSELTPENILDAYSKTDIFKNKYDIISNKK